MPRTFFPSRDTGEEKDRRERPRSTGRSRLIFGGYFYNEKRQNAMKNDARERSGTKMDFGRGGSLIEVEIAFANGVARQLGHAVAAQLVENVAAVGVHGVLADAELFGDLLGVASLG